MPHPRWPTIRLLLLGIVVLVVVEHLVATVGVQLSAVPVRTDFASYYLAGSLAAQHRDPYPPENLAAAGHQLGFAYDQAPFLYPPQFALAMLPFASLPFASARRLWILLSTVCLFAALAVLARLISWQTKQLALPATWCTWGIMVPFVVMVLHSSPVHNDLRSASVGSALLLSLVLLLDAAVRSRARAAGLWLAIATLLKVVPLVLLPWLAWRCGRRALWTTLLVSLLSLLPAVLFWGPSIVTSSLRHGAWAATHIELAWAHNVSLRAALLRLLGSDVATPAGTSGLPSWASASISLMAEMAVAGVTLWVVRLRRAGALLLEASVLVLALFLVMRITWVYTLTAMLFAYPILLSWSIALRREQRRRGTLLVWGCSVGFFLAAAHLPVLWGERWLQWPWVLGAGLHPLGLLLLWGVGVLLLRRPPQLPGVMEMRLA